MMDSRGVAQLATLFLAKFGALIVGVIFLPIYSRQLGADTFGVVAVILSAQAFALLADFGMTTLVGRDLAQSHSSHGASSTILRLAEFTITAPYAVLLAVAAPAAAIVDLPLGTVSVVGCIFLIYFTLIQNINQTALLACKDFVASSGIQVAGVVLRATGTTLVLLYWRNGIESFIWTQCAFTAAHAVITRLRWKQLCARRSANVSDTGFTLKNILRSIERGFPILLAGLAGAAVLQLDKPIISYFASPAALTPYYLAASFSILPTSLLAAPVVQFFQPRLLSLIGRDSESDEKAPLIRAFTYSLFAIVALPTLAIWIWSPEIIAIWLRNSDQVAKVVEYCKILLPGFALGSMSYVPVVLLLAIQDFRYQAATAIFLTCLTLAAVTLSAMNQRIDLACLSYIGYFFAASLSVWIRAFSFRSLRPLASLAALSAFKPLLALIVLIFALRII